MGLMPFPPLVEPVARLPHGEIGRAARQIRLPEIGEVGQRRLAAARVAVLGAGGLGSPVLQYLASAGIGTLGIIDFDTVEATNLQRQVLFGVQDVGRPKARVAAERVAALSPSTRTECIEQELTPDNAAGILADYDVVVDGSDAFPTRYALADACDALGVPLVWGSVLRFDAQATLFWSAPPTGVPVSLRDVFPTAPPAQDVPSCATAGVVGAACGQLGALLAMEVIRLVCGIGEPLLGRMLVIDALTSRTREVPLSPSRPDAAGSPAAGAQPDARGTAASAATRVPQLDLAAARALGARLIDVREPEETELGVLPGAETVPLARILADAGHLALTGPTVLYCRRGPRARVAAHALLAAHPGADVRILAGGYDAYADHADHAEVENHPTIPIGAA